MSEDQNKVAEKPLDDNIASVSKGIAPKNVDVEEGEVPSSQGKSKREDKDSAQAANGNDNKEKGKSKRDKSSEDKSSDDEDAVDKKSKKKKKDKSKKKDKDKKSEKKADKKEKRSHSREKKPSKRDREKSSSRSRSRSKQDSRRKRRSRSRSKDNKRKKDESPNRSKRRSTSRTRRRSSSKQKDRKQDKYRDNRDDRDRSRDARRKSRSPVRREKSKEKVRQSDSRARPVKEGKEPPRDSGRDRRKDDISKGRKMEVVEDEPLDEETQKKIESQLAFAEEDEEAIAARAREQRKALLEQARKAKEEEELAFMQQQQAMAVEEEEKQPVAVEEKVIEKKVKDKPVRKAEKFVKELAEKTESEKIKEVIREDKNVVPAEAGDSLTKMQEEEEGKQNDEKEQQPNYKHDVDKEKYIKMIESMREKLQQEEEDLRENGDGEDGAEDKNKEAEGGKKDEDAQDFDMFCETPESVEAEKVAPIVGVDNSAYDDENGYYRGQIGEVVNGRYKILAKLGKGVFGNVFKGTDMETNQDVAMKVVKSEEIYLMSGLKEKEILMMLNEADRHNKRHVIRLLDSFEYRRHLILVFELMEMDLRSAIKTFGKKLGLSIESVRSYARQLFISLAHLRKHKIIHADLKPDNILVTNNQKTLKLSDFGSAFPVEENTITPYLVARYYRAPEIILGCPYDAAVDMWSAACTIFELYTGKMLFPGRDNNEMLKLILQTKGRFNNKMVKRGEFASQYFDHQNNFLSTEIDPVTKLKYVKPIPIGGKITRDIGNLLNAVEIELSEEDRKKVAQLKDLLERCLTLDPNKRISPDEALRHTFINYTVQKIATDHNTLKHAF